MSYTKCCRDPRLHEILSMYYSVLRSCDQSKIVVKHIIQEHHRRVIVANDEEDTQPIHVRRSNLIQDTIKAFSRPKFNVSKLIKVSFIGESSVDEGGPRREFFQLTLKETFTTLGLFAGWPSNLVPLHNVEAVTKNLYFVIGKLIATCLVQGGQAPACFCKGVADYLIFDEVRSIPCLEDIPDFFIREKLQKVKYIFQ